MFLKIINDLLSAFRGLSLLAPPLSYTYGFSSIKANLMHSCYMT